MAYVNDVINLSNEFPFNDNISQDPSLAAGSRTGIAQDAITMGGCVLRIMASALEFFSQCYLPLPFEAES